MAIGRLFKSIWYALTGRAHEMSDKIMENPEAVRGAAGRWLRGVLRVASCNPVACGRSA